MTLSRRAMAALPLWLGLGGFTVPQPVWNGGHPESFDPMWNLLNQATVTVDRKQGLMVAAFPADVQRLAGMRLHIEGFILPLEAGRDTRHFALTRRNSACPFCPPNLPSEAVEVGLTKPVEVGPELIVVTGVLALRPSSEAGLFYELQGATVV